MANGASSLPIDQQAAFEEFQNLGQAEFESLQPTAKHLQLAREYKALEDERGALPLSKAALQLGIGTGEVGKGGLQRAVGGFMASMPPMAAIDLIPGLTERRQQYGRELSQIGTESVRQAEEIGQELGGGKPGEVIRQLGGTFTVSAPAIPAGLVGGLPLAAITAAGIQQGSSFNQFKDYYQNQGLSEQEAERRAFTPSLVSGAITGTLTRIIPGGTEMLLSKLATGELTRGGIKELVKRGVKEVAKEIPEEGLDQIGQGFTEKLMVNPNKSIKEIADETVFAMGAAGTLAGLTAGGLTVIGKTAQAVARPIERRTRRIGEPTYAPTQRQVQESVQPQRIETPPRGISTEASLGDIVQPTAPVQAQETPLTPEFPLRPGTTTTWEDQKGIPVRQVPNPEQPETWKWERVQPSTESPDAPTQTQTTQVPPQPAPVQAAQEPATPQAQLLTKIAPVSFLQVQEGMPELVWYRLNADITSPDGRVYPAGRNISNGELARFGYSVPESEAKKALPVQLPTIGRFELPGTPAEQYETVLQTIRNANANTKAKIQALFPRAEISREQAQSLRNLAFPETKEVAQTSFSWERIDTSTPQPGPLSRFEVGETIANFKRQFPGTPVINVVNSESELPAEVLAAKPADFRPIAAWQGMDDGTGRIWLVADRFTSPKKLTQILAHEIVGHHGLESLMGDDIKFLARAVEQRFRNTPTWQRITQAYGTDQTLIGRELLANLAESPDQDLSLWQQIVAVIQKWWRENINPNRAISDLEIRRALMRSRRFLQQQPAVEYREFSPEGDLITAYAGETPPIPVVDEARRMVGADELRRRARILINNGWIGEVPEDHGKEAVGLVSAAQYTVDNKWTPEFEANALKGESPFDRMRRESGAEPPPELTPEQKAARERNERIRGRRPETLFAGEEPQETRPTPKILEPEEKLAQENDDDLWIETRIGGQIDKVRDRIQITTQSTTDAQKYAKAMFDKHGIKVRWVETKPATDLAPSRGYWEYTEKNDEGFRQLAQAVDLEMQGPPTDDRALLLGSLINSIRFNDRLGNAVGKMDEPTQIKLYTATQHEASIRGARLQELNQHPATLPQVTRNVNAVLHRIFHDAYGGEVLDNMMTEIRRGIQAFLTQPLISQVLANNPQLAQALAGLNPEQLIKDVFKKPFYRAEDFGKMLQSTLVKDHSMTEADAARIADMFQKAFNPSIQAGADEALKIAVRNLKPRQKAAVKSNKTVEQIIRKAIKKGQFDNIEPLKEIAKEHGYREVSPEEIAKLKKLSQKEEQLRELSPQEVDEANKNGWDLERQRQIKEAANNPDRVRILKDLEVRWSRIVRPINIPTWKPSSWKPAWETRANAARGINEFIAANLLYKVAFGTRQLWAIFSQWLSYVPTRAMADALVNVQHGHGNFFQESARVLRDAYKTQYGALMPALNAMKGALLGRAEAFDVGRLMTGMSALDRITKLAEEHWAKKDYGRAGLLYFIASAKAGYRVAQGLDRLQGVPAHYQNTRELVIRALRDEWKTSAEAQSQADLVIGDIKQQLMLATAEAKQIREAEGLSTKPAELRQAAFAIAKRRMYQRIQDLGFPADDFEAQSRHLENTIGWNLKETRGVGGAIATGMRKAEQVAEDFGIPLVVTRFANAIGIQINRILAHTPLWKQANLGVGPESAWFKSETDKAQRRVESYVGYIAASILIPMVLARLLVVRTKWPKDKEERDRWEREGHRPGTVEWRVGMNGEEFIPFSLNNSMFMLFAPYLAGAGALRDLLDERAKAQAKLDEEAAKKGLPPGKIKPMSTADMFAVAAQAAQQAVLGGRTAAGLIGSVTTYGLPNAKKTAASYVSAMVPGLPGAQELSRMAGVKIDERMASFWDLLLPLESSQSKKLNVLGDPVRTPNDIQRIMQIATGGTYLGIVKPEEAREAAGYRAWFGSGYNPPSINPSKGYPINGVYRPMDDNELVKYTQLRGRYFKEGLMGLGDTATKEQAQAAYEQANRRALSEVGVQVPAARTTTARGTTTTRRTVVRGPRRLRTRGISRLRRPRVRRLSYRRPRLVSRRPRVRRIRRLAA